MIRFCNYIVLRATKQFIQPTSIIRNLDYWIFSIIGGRKKSLGTYLHFRRFVNDPGIIAMEEYCNSNIGKIIFIDFSETIDYFDVISMLIILTNLYVPFFPPSERSLAYWHGWALSFLVTQAGAARRKKRNYNKNPRYCPKYRSLRFKRFVRNPDITQ